MTTEDIYEQSNASIMRQIGARMKDYRLHSRLTQKQLAEQSGISVMTVSLFEQGKNKNVSLDTLLRLLRTLRELECTKAIFPEQPMSPFLLQKIQKSAPKRIKHGKKRQENVDTDIHTSNNR